MKILTIIILAIVISPGVAFGHPDTLDVKIAALEPGTQIKIMGLEKPTKQDDIQIETFSEYWFYKNIAIVLGSGITVIMAIVCSLIYREEITKKLIRN